jgi:hypothetical protein
MEKYFNGRCEIDVEYIGNILTLNQNQTNLLAVGPQESFFNILDLINNEMRYYDIEPLNVTNVWNWSPGSHNKIEEYINKRLEVNKKSSTLSKKLSRTKERVNYMNYIERNLSRVEHEKAELKRMAIPRNIDLDEFSVKWKEFAENILSQCEQAWKASDYKVKITPFLQMHSNQAYLYLDILLTDLNMNLCQSGESETTVIQDIPLKPIRLVLKLEIRKLIANRIIAFNSNLGIYDDEGTQFPFLHSNRRNLYGSVCFDSYHDDIRKAIQSNNYVILATLLLQWAQYYHLGETNPYNQPYRLFLGVPDYVSKEYLSLIPIDGQASICQDYLSNKAWEENLELFDRDNYISNYCDSINCQIKDKCNMSMEIKQTQDALNDNENYCIAESKAGFIMDYIINYHFNKAGKHWNDTLDEFLSLTNCYIDMYEKRFRIDEDETKTIDENKMFEWMAKKILYDILSLNNSGVYKHTLEKIQFYVKETPSTKDMSKEQMETIMKSWAQAQERG